MAAKKSDGDGRASERVLSTFAYATTKSGEVVQLVKGDVIDPDRFDDDSIEHLRSIGFIGKSE